MRSVAKARPMHCAILAKELDTWIWAKPRRSISRAKSSVARRRPGVAIRLRAGKGEGMGFLQEYFVDHSPRSERPDRHSGAPHSGEPGIHIPEAGVHGFRASPCGRSRNDAVRKPRGLIDAEEGRQVGDAWQQVRMRCAPEGRPVSGAA